LINNVGDEVDEVNVHGAAAETGEVGVAHVGPDCDAPLCAAPVIVARMVRGSPAWNLQATFALVTMSSISASSPRIHCPKPSPRSLLRSTTLMRASSVGG
jgi:hypothetical protein